jgi:hypothetical protein
VVAAVVNKVLKVQLVEDQVLLLSVIQILFLLQQQPQVHLPLQQLVDLEFINGQEAGA